MTPSRLPISTARRVAALAAVATIGLAGCAGTGFTAQTNEQYQAGIGANVRTGPIRLYNALAVANGDGTATFSAAILNRSGSPAKLTGASARGSNGSAVSVTTAPAIIDPGQVFSTGKGGTVMLADKALKAGSYVNVTLKFSGGDRVSVDAPVVARNATYDGVATNSGGETATPATPTPTAIP